MTFVLRSEVPLYNVWLDGNVSGMGRIGEE